jgi:SAM-dependent methyltransferase
VLRDLFRQLILLPTFGRSKTYWERRYRLGGTSGTGSYGVEAEFKAEVLNRFVREKGVERVIEFGCGDGHQLGLAEYPLYLGIDVSRTAIEMCRDRFRGDPRKSFLWYDPETTVNIANFVKADLTLSVDVIYHLVEDYVYEKHLDDLFLTSRRFVIVYSSNKEERTLVPHVRHRKFTVDVERRFPAFRLVRTVENRYPERSFASFFIFEGVPSEDARQG